MVTLDEAQAQGIVLGLNEITGEVRDRLDIDELLLQHLETFNRYSLHSLPFRMKRNPYKSRWDGSRSRVCFRPMSISMPLT